MHEDKTTTNVTVVEAPPLPAAESGELAQEATIAEAPDVLQADHVDADDMTVATDDAPEVAEPEVAEAGSDNLETVTDESSADTNVADESTSSEDAETSGDANHETEDAPKKKKRKKKEKPQVEIAAAAAPPREYTEEELKAAVEAVMFAADDPILHKDLRKLFPGTTKAVLDRAIAQLQLDYSGDGKGVHLMDIAGGFQFRTNPTYNDVLMTLFEAKPIRISKPAMETLAIVSYRQPVPKSEVDEIRGVDCSGTLKKLLDLDLVTVVGKADDIGRPNLYGTTQRFLEFFGLDALTELPTLEKFEIDALELVGENLKDFLPDDDAPILDEETKSNQVTPPSDGDIPDVSASSGANDDGVQASESETEPVAGDASADGSGGDDPVEDTNGLSSEAPTEAAMADDES